MNIFYLDHSYVTSAVWAVDRHTVKMILESTQLLSTAHRVLDGKEETIIKNGRRNKIWKLDDPITNRVLLKATHQNHPSAVWVRESRDNYYWLVKYLTHLHLEYTHRYGKIHSYCTNYELNNILHISPKNISDIGLTKIPCAMPEEYIISDDSVENYRNYYKFGKSHLHSWKNRQPPPWI
jgi:hypothetical protein